MTDSHIPAENTVGIACAAENARARCAREVVFLLLNDLALLDLAGPMDAFQGVNAELPGSYRIHFVSPHRSVRAAGGLTLSRCAPLYDALAPETTLVISGVTGTGGHVDPCEPATRQAIAWLRKAAGMAQLLCVSSGGVLAAHAGLLSGRLCTTHPASIGELRKADPSARVLDNRTLVADGLVLSCAGVSAAVDLALQVIGRHFGARLVANVARRLIVFSPRTSTDALLSPWAREGDHLHPAVHRVQEAVRRNPKARWTSADLSAAACTSIRNLSRLFREHAGCSPLHYVQQTRLALAKPLLMQSRLDLKSVAARTGFSSAQQLRRVWSRWHGRPPSVLRGRITGSRGPVPLATALRNSGPAL